jgi:hypothetical protein
MKLVLSDYLETALRNPPSETLVPTNKTVEVDLFPPEPESFKGPESPKELHHQVRNNALGPGAILRCFQESLHLRDGQDFDITVFDSDLDILGWVSRDPFSFTPAIVQKPVVSRAKWLKHLGLRPLSPAGIEPHLRFRKPDFP